MKRFNIIKRFTAMFAAAALVLASCSSDPEVKSVVVNKSDKTNLVLKSSECSASYLSTTTLAFKIKGEDTFKALLSTSDGAKYAKCFTVGVSDGAEYNEEFEGSALRVESDGSIEIEVAQSLLSQSDVVTLSYQKDVDNPLVTKGGYELESFSGLVVADTGVADASYEVVSWKCVDSSDKNWGKATSFYYVSGDTSNNKSLTFTDTSMEGAGFEYYVSSAWYYYNVDDESSKIESTERSCTVTDTALNAISAGVQTLHMNSIFKRPVYCFVDGVKQVSYKIVDKSDANYGYYQMDLQFDFVVYPAAIDASFKLYTDAALRSEKVADATTGNYEVFVGDTYYLAGKTSDYDGAFALAEGWKIEDSTAATIEYDEKDVNSNSVKIYFSDVTECDGAKVTYTASDDRSATMGVAKEEGTKESLVKAILNPDAVYYTAELYAESGNAYNQIMLTLNGSDTFNEAEFDADVYATMFRLDVAAKGAVSDGITMNSTAVELSSDKRSLYITFNQYLYDGESYMLYYTGQEINYLGVESLTVNELYTGTTTDKSMIKNVPRAVTGGAARYDYATLGYSFVSDGTTKSELEINADSDNTINIVMKDGEASRRVEFSAQAVQNVVNGVSASDADAWEISNIRWRVDDNEAQDNENNPWFKFGEGSATVEMTAVSKRPIAGYKCEYDAAGFCYNISKTFTVNCYAYKMTAELSYYTDSACAGTPLAAVGGTLSLGAGQSLYIVNSTFGTTFSIDTQSVTLDTFKSLVVENGEVVGAKFDGYMTFSAVGLYNDIVFSVERPSVTDTFSGAASEVSSYSETNSVDVTMVDLGFDWSYYSVTTLRLTLDNGAKFDVSKVPAADLAQFMPYFSLYYDGAGLDASSMVAIKALSYQLSNTTLQITLNGGTTDRMYSDDKLYLKFDAAAAAEAGLYLYTDDAFGRTVPAIDEAYSNYLSSGVNLEHLPFTNVLTDASFNFTQASKMSNGDLNYYTSVAKCPEGVWTFGNATASYSVAAVVDDPLGSGGKAIRLVPNPKSASTPRALYNGTHLKVTSGATYFGSFEYYIPATDALTSSGVTEDSGDNLRPPLNYYLGSDASFTSPTSGAVVLTSAVIGEYYKYQGAWWEDTQVSTYTSATSTMPRALSLNTYGTSAFHRICFYPNRFDLEIYVRNFRLEKVETRPK